LKIAPTAVTQWQVMCTQTKKNVAMADELVLSHKDETQIHHSTHQAAQFAVMWIIFHGDLGERRLLKL